MSTFINEESYKKLIDEDIVRLEKEMQPSPEREHIKAILEWSINQLYKDENTQKSTD
jgi:hypothetical protein